MSATTIPARAARLFGAPAAAPEPFRSAEAAWFWAWPILEARREGAGHAFGHQRRICEPDDVVKAIDRLYRQRRIELRHARALREAGERGHAPTDERSGDGRLWREAIAQLEQALRARGIVR